MALMEACLAVLRGREGQPEDEQAVYRPAIPDLFRVPEALIRVRALVEAMTEPRPLSAFWLEMPMARRSEQVVVRSAVASTFVAALELCRSAVVGLDQQEHCGVITVLPCIASTPSTA